jgi:hypothetical protein
MGKDVGGKMRAYEYSRETLQELCRTGKISPLQQGRVKIYPLHTDIKVCRVYGTDKYNLYMSDDLYDEFEKLLGGFPADPNQPIPPKIVDGTGYVPKKVDPKFCSCNDPHHEMRYFGTFKYNYCVNCKKEAHDE